MKTIAIYFLTAVTAFATSTNFVKIENLPVATGANAGDALPLYHNTGTAFQAEQLPVQNFTASAASNAMNSSALGGIGFNTFATPFDTYWMTNVYLEWWSADLIGTNDGTMITNWIGRNGNTLMGNATYVTMAIHGHPGVFFDGSGNNILTNSALIGQNMTNAGTVFVVFRVPRSVPTPGNYSTVLSAQTTSGVDDAFLIANWSNSSYQDYWPGLFSEDFGGNLLTLHHATTYHNGDDVRVYCVTWSKNYLADFWDGNLDNYYPSGGYSGPTTPQTPAGFSGVLSIGQLTTRQWPLNGYVGDLLIFTNQLSFASINQVNSYFSTKYKLQRNTILLIGDSMIAGGVSSWGGNWSDILATNFPQWTVENVGLPGCTTPRIMTNVLVSAGNAFPGNNKVAVLWNDLVNDGASQIANITNDQMTMGLTLRSNGWRVLLVNPPSAQNSDVPLVNGQPFRSVYQNWATNCYGQYFDGIVDLSKDIYVGYSNAWTNTFYYSAGDGTHWTNPAFAETAVNWLIPALNQVLSPSTNFAGGITLGNSLNFNYSVGSNAEAAINEIFPKNGWANGGFGFVSFDGNFEGVSGPAFPLTPPSFVSFMHVDTVGDTFLGENAGNWLSGNQPEQTTAIGLDALESETASDPATVAIGYLSMQNDVTPSADVAIGHLSMAHATSSQNNVGIGQGALYQATSAIDETAIGYRAGLSESGGSGDIYIGFEAGYNVSSGSSNIDIGNLGKSGDQNVIRIGTTQTNCAIAGSVTTSYGFGSTATNTLPFSSTGITNTLPVNLRLIGFTASGAFDISNTLTGWHAHFGSAPAQMFILQPGECVFASGGLSEGTNIAF